MSEIREAPMEIDIKKEPNRMEGVTMKPGQVVEVASEEETIKTATSVSVEPLPHPAQCASGVYRLCNQHVMVLEDGQVMKVFLDPTKPTLTLTPLKVMGWPDAK